MDGLPQIKKGKRGPKLRLEKNNPGPMKKIYINRNTIRDNKNNSENEPVISVNTYNSNEYGHEVIIYGFCRIIYDPEKAKKGEVSVWIETYSPVDVILRQYQAIAA
jgi:hypothetical protein